MASSVNLGSRLESIVDDLVENGRYNSRSEVPREGVRLVHERERWLADLDASIERGIADADAGRVYPAEEVFDEIDAELAAMEEARSTSEGCPASPPWKGGAGGGLANQERPACSDPPTPDPSLPGRGEGKTNRGAGIQADPLPPPARLALPSLRRYVPARPFHGTYSAVRPQG